jgi:hypothetical protein
MKKVTDIPIVSKNNITVYESHSRDKCIRFGKGQSFCISQPGNTNKWQFYREDRISTFYFVFDRNKDESDPLSIVVIDSNQYGIELTDKNNKTGNISEYGKDAEGYLDYLESMGINRNIFKHIPLTEEEIKDEEMFGRENLDFDWFIKLSPEDKMKYISRDHFLSDDQFKWLVDNNVRNLVLLYLENARSHEDVYNFIKNDKQYLKKMKYVAKNDMKTQHTSYIKDFNYILFSQEEILNDENFVRSFHERSSSEFEKASLYLFKKDKNFNINSIPKEVIDLIKEDTHYSYEFAKSFNFNLDKIPKEIINEISKYSIYSYNFAENVNFDLNKIPKPMIDSISASLNTAIDFVSNFIRTDNFSMKNIPIEIINSIAKSSYASFDLASVSIGHDILNMFSIPTEIINSIAKSLERVYLLAKLIDFDITKLPKEIINRIAETHNFSFMFAKYADFNLNKLPKEILDTIAENNMHSYDFAKAVDFNLNKVPQPIINSANKYESNIKWIK